MPHLIPCSTGTGKIVMTVTYYGGPMNRAILYSSALEKKGQMGSWKNVFACLREDGFYLYLHEQVINTNVVDFN